MSTIKTPKKLIEVALPLNDINLAAAKEKSIRHGHPSTLHIWWARRPLAAARAVIFAQMVNDPGYERSLGRGVNREKAAQERERLFNIIRRLVKWENSDDQGLLNEALAEIKKSWQETCELNKSHKDAGVLFNPEVLPAFHDPFAGGGAIPLEAQRLGLESFATDLNPVAVLLNKAMVEIPYIFANRPPVGPASLSHSQGRLDPSWSDAKGLAEDVRRYGSLVRQKAFEKIGHLYPKVKLSAEHGGGEASVIAWIWARTVKSPNPAYSHSEIPLVSSFVLSNKPGGEAFVSPRVAGDSFYFEVKQGKPPAHAKNGTKAARGANFVCLLSGTPVNDAYVKAESQAGRIGARLMAVVVEGPRGRVYLPPTSDQEKLAELIEPSWKPDQKMNKDTKDLVSGRGYGFHTWADLFTKRQLIALSTLSELVDDMRPIIRADAERAGLVDDGLSLADGGRGASAYADAISVYLAMTVSRSSDRHCTMCSWDSGPATKTSSTGSPARSASVRNAFSRQALAMTWDFAEGNPFSDSATNYLDAVNWICKVLDRLTVRAPGFALQQDAQRQEVSKSKVVSTDPPYYDNIAYADLSDFFYIWLRKSLRPIFGELFSTMAVPKDEELVASAYRHGGKSNAEKFFLNGMTNAMGRIAEQSHPAFPTTIYYAFKQSENTEEGTGNTGWETFLEAVIRSGFSISGTWPMRTELANRMIGSGTNALASSIVLVCRKRDSAAETISRRDFIRELKEELVEAVDAMIGGADGVSPVAPVDLAQAVIGPGMAIFSKYSSVLEADGSPMSVHSALMLINRMLTEGVEEFDADTQFCLAWFDGQGWSSGDYGSALVLAQAKGTVVDRVRDAGVIEAAAGKVRLLKPAEYVSDWTPENDNNTPVWEALHQLIRALREGGETSAGSLLAGMPERAEPIRSLAYRLYTLCERKGWADDARAYNELITSWTGIEAASHEKGHFGSQTKFDI